jgi:hypothetical protein
VSPRKSTAKTAGAYAHKACTDEACTDDAYTGEAGADEACTGGSCRLLYQVSPAGFLPRAGDEV